ncbi:MAG TPA: hypothetical protein VH161_04005 [Candidatus Acidoferrales bacterium]|nr:hypothetical protein [Candidatus Acidoferrales bacterium]
MKRSMKIYLNSKSSTPTTEREPCCQAEFRAEQYASLPAHDGRAISIIPAGDDSTLPTTYVFEEREP